MTTALGSYTSGILELVEEGQTVCGKLRFHGIHRAPLFGHALTGRHVWWFGAPIFQFEGTKVHDLWVLGDIHALWAQLRGDSPTQPV